VKNLKIKVKNAQLAEALNMRKKPAKKKAPAKKAAPKKEAKPKQDEPERKKPIRKATKKPKSFSLDGEEPKKPEPKIVEEAPKAEAIQEKPAAEVEKPKQEERKAPAKYTPKQKVEVIRRGPGPKPEKKPETSARKDDKKGPPSAAAATAKPADKKKEYYSKPTKKLKPAPGRFDARARQGLSEYDEGGWRRRRGGRKKAKINRDEQLDRPKSLKVKLPIMVKDLAHDMKLKSSEIIGKLFMQGVTLTLNDYLDDETVVQLVGHEFGCDIQIDTSQEERLRITDKSITEEISEAKDKVARAPVVAFMGHVDHGKTSLIDSIRKSEIAAGEAGAITQHIGAFRCHTAKGEVTILDTPGHEAFSEMRERGANVTDVVILVVAGDEGIKPQTDEAIEKAKEAGVTIIVAINKCDKPDFNADEVYRQLAERELLPEAWGGQTITVNCSAKTGEGIQELIEMAHLQAEVLELGAVPETRARGTVLESSLHHGLGAVATVLVQNGTLKPNDSLVFDHEYGRVRTMHNEHGKMLDKAGPSIPVKITGLSGLPEAGSEFIVVESEKEAKRLIEERLSGRKHAELKHIKKEHIEHMLERSQELAQKKVLNLIIKADVQGSLEALKSSLMKIPSNKVELNIISADVGKISESDTQLAMASSAPIIAFHTSLASGIDEVVKREKIKVCTHDVIYHLINDVKELMKGTLDKIREEHHIGTLKVQATFKASSLGVIAGCIVEDGMIKRDHIAKIKRDGEIVWEGKIASVKREKEDVKEVAKGLECGVLLENYNEVQTGDQILTYEIVYKEQEL